MKYIRNIGLSFVLFFASFGALATPGLGVITITTDDPVKYMKWITNAVPVFKEAWGKKSSLYGVGRNMGNHEALIYYLICG